MRKTVILAIITFALPLAFQQAPAALVYRQGEGWSSESENEEPPGKNADEQQRKAEAAENKGDLKRALSAYKTLVRRWSKSDNAPKAQLRIGLPYEKLGIFDTAFDAYGKYISSYPKGDDFDAAVAAQFRIAQLFLQGERQRLLGIPTLASMSRAQLMFESIVKEAPFSKFAPLCQFDIGLAMEKQDKNTEAIAQYQTVLTRYPTDAVAADAQYQIGYVYLMEARRGSNDQSASGNARDAFEDFISRYPTSEKVSQAKDNLNSLSGKDTLNAYDVARFYDKKKNYKAAVIYYNEVIRQDPGSAQSNAAKARIEALKGQVGEDVLRAGPERTETGERAQSRRKLQAQVETAARPDYLGPPVVVPDEVAPDTKPKLRTPPVNVGPVPAVEPPLPQQ